MSNSTQDYTILLTADTVLFQKRYIFQHIFPKILANLFSLYFPSFRGLISPSFKCSQTVLYIGIDNTISCPVWIPLLKTTVQQTFLQAQPQQSIRSHTTFRNSYLYATSTRVMRTFFPTCMCRVLKSEAVGTVQQQNDTWYKLRAWDGNAIPKGLLRGRATGCLASSMPPPHRKTRGRSSQVPAGL